MAGRGETTKAQGASAASEVDPRVYLSPAGRGRAEGAGEEALLSCETVSPHPPARGARSTSPSWRGEKLSASAHDLYAPPTFAGSALAHAARRAADHFGARDAPPDPIEVWGRRIGRALSLVGCIGLGIYLYVTYLR